MRKDLEECGRACYRREYPWGLVTNGLLLSRQRLDRLLQAGLHSITVSLDGPEDAHNWLRRHPESFRRASQAIGMLSREKEIVWDVVSCIQRIFDRTRSRTMAYLYHLSRRQSSTSA